MNSSMLEEARELGEWSKECEALSIYQELSKIEDTRGKQGKRYGVTFLLTSVLLAKMAGETTLQAISECDCSKWVGEQERGGCLPGPSRQVGGVP